MKFTIENGTDICTIGLSDVGSYIRFDYPLTVVWYDNRGSVGKYFCALPYNENYRTIVKNKINDNLNQDFTDNIQGLYEILEPLLPIFKNGSYNLHFYSNKEKEFFRYQTSSDNYVKYHFFQLEVVFTQNTTQIQNIENIKQEHKKYFQKNQISKEHYLCDLLEYTTDGIYEGWRSLFATQPLENIDQNRVKYFEEKIEEGERPFAILFNARLDSEDLDSSYFILDGHHKLLAYKNLGIYPPIAVVTHLPKNAEETEFDAEKLAASLYPWQTEHILKHWEGKDAYIERVLENPSSNLHRFIKNGDHEEYHENGKLKHKAFYINDKVDGCSKHWYDNGQLKTEEYYNKGVRTGVWTTYFTSGKISFIQPFDENGNYHGTLVSFFEDGQKRLEQEFENGKNKDGVSYTVWFENGSVEAELTYKNGQMISRKNWVSWGYSGRKFVNHEVFNEETKKLEKIEIPSDKQHVYNSAIQQKRQEEIMDKNMNLKYGFWNQIKRLFK